MQLLEKNTELLLSQRLKIGGLSIVVRSRSAQVISWLRFDFSYFLSDDEESATDVVFTVLIESPDNYAIPPLDQSMLTPYWVCFEKGCIKYVDYQGKALLIYDYSTEHGTVYCEEPAVAYERLYLAVLSRVGEKMDLGGKHRVHALGITFSGKGCLFLMPAGGGKSTLALSLLRDERVKLVSEDSPLINRAGGLLPFPFRMGITNGENTESIPEPFKRDVTRMYGGTKVLVDINWLRGRIQGGKVRNSFIFCGRRTTASSPRLVPVSRVEAFKALLKDCVLGVGLPQVIELFLRSGCRAFLEKGLIASSRLVAAVALSFRSQAFILYLCSDREKNAQLVLSFLERNYEG
jgi:hypothetical protein